MKAAQLSDYGPAANFRITDVAKPEPGPTDVLVKVHFAGLRWGDIMARNGIPVRSATPPFVPGQEASGTVAAVGKDVTTFQPGDRVTAQPMNGAYAEFVNVPVARVHRVADNVPLETALVYRVNMPTAYMAVYEWAKVQEGESVLLHAAAGGVGTLIVQILKRRFKDVKLIGLASTDEKCASVLRNGADHAINYKTTDYIEAVEQLVGKKPRGFAPGAPPAGVHVVLNGVAGKTLQTDRLVIRRLGRWVLFGTPAGVEPVNLYAHSYDSIAIMPFSIIPFAGTPQLERAQAFTQQWLATEALLAPTIRPLEEVAAAQMAMERGESQGKVVFAVAEGVS